MSSLAEAWGETDNYSNLISAKPVILNQSDSTSVSKTNTSSVQSKQVAVVENEEVVKLLKALLLEFHELRREQARRCSVYMIMIGILFGIMILYVDKLNHNISKSHSSRPYL